MKNPFSPIAAIPESGIDSPGRRSRRAASGSSAPPRVMAAHAFGKRLNHVRPFMVAALTNFTLVAPVLLVAAVGLSVLAVVQASSFISAFTRQAKSAEVMRMSPLIDKKPLLAADYQSAANIIAKNNSAVQVALSKSRNAIVLTIKDPARLPEFVFALATIQSYRQGVAWNAVRLCLNKCEGGTAASAEVTGYTQAISFSGLRAQ
jgi:hypothetical protein